MQNTKPLAKAWRAVKLDDSSASMEDLLPLSAETMELMLQKCRKEKNAAHARHLYAYIQTHGTENHVALGNYIVPMLANAGDVSDALQIFRKLDNPNEYSWNSLINSLIKRGDGRKAFTLYEDMRKSSVKPTGYTFVALLKSCADLRDIKMGRKLHVDIVSYNLETQLFVGSSLVDMYAKCGFLQKSQVVFEKLLMRDAVSWNALISGYFKHGLCEEALSSFKQMQFEGVAPTVVTLVFILKVCGSLMNLQEGRNVHAYISENGGLEGDLDISNALIDLYANCGLLEEAENLFEELSMRTAASWAALIAGYSKYQLDSDVLRCFWQMCAEGTTLNVYTSVCSLKACGSIGDSEKAEKVHAQILREGLLENGNNVVGTAVVDMYANCGMLDKAHEMFNSLFTHDIVSWTALIAGYSKHGKCETAFGLFKEMQLSGISPDTFCWNALIEGCAKCGHGEEALNCFELMKSEGMCPDVFTFVFSLKACCTMKTKQKAQGLHSDIVVRGFFEKDIVVGNTLIYVYVNHGMVPEAQYVFNNLPVQDIVSWTALIGGYAESRHCEKALEYFSQLQRLGLAPTVITYVCVLNACNTVCIRESGQEIHSEIEKKGFFDDDLYVGNALIDMYVNCGLLDEAQEVFDTLPTQDIISWTSLISGYAMHGHSAEALNCFKHMIHEGINPDAVCWSALITGYAKHSLGEEALNCLKQMKLDGISPDVVTFASSLKACGIVRAIQKGHDIHAEITMKGFLEIDVIVGNALIDMYATCGSLAEAQHVFNRLLVRDAISWTALIAGYTRHGFSEEALDCFEQMKKNGFSPDVVTYLCSLKACGSIGVTEQGERIHAEVSLNGLMEKHSVVANAVLDMYTNFGLMEKAQEVFSKLPMQSAGSWTSLIAGYSKHGFTHDALNCFEHMQLEGLSPDVLSWNALISGYAHLGESETVFCMLDGMMAKGIQPSHNTVTSVLTACSHAGHVDVGSLYFVGMSKACGIKLTIEHHVCMIDLFGRMGQLNKAVAVILLMPYHPNLVVWHTVFCACRKWGNVEMGIWAFSHALQLDEGDTGSYVSLYNIYGDAGARHHAWAEDAC